MMKNTRMTVVLKYQSSNKLQRKDIVNLMRKVAKQWQFAKQWSLDQLTLSVDYAPDETAGWGDYCPFIWKWAALPNMWHSGLGNSLMYFYNLHCNTYSKNPFKPSKVFTACCKPWKWHIVYSFFLGSEQPIQLQLLLAVELLFTILIVCVLCKWICNYLVPNLTTLGLQDIGNGNDIDIGAQYCDIDITHDIYAFYTISVVLVMILKIGLLIKIMIFITEIIIYLI